MPPARLDRSPLLLFLSGALSGALCVLIWRATVGTGDGSLELFRDVRHLAATSFVRALSPEELTSRALDGMVSSLDPYSRFLRGADAERVERETSGLFRGLGIVFRTPPDPDQVLFALPSSPAERAGLRPGDRIVSISGRPFAELDRSALHDALLQREEHGVALEVRRRAGAVEAIRIEPGSVPEPSVRHEQMLAGPQPVGYLALTSFTQRSPAEFDAALERLLASDARALILDLRANPGGVLEAAIEIAGRFLREGPVATTDSRAGRREHAAEPVPGRHAGLPLIVLVDGGSASASEVLAGALQDHRAAVIVGEPTYGKAVVQTVTRFREHGVAVKLTTAVYRTPSGRALGPVGEPEDAEHPAGEAGGGAGFAGARRGIEPDLRTSVASEERARIHRWLHSYDPPTAARGEIERWSAELGQDLLPEHGPDAELELALELLRGRRPGPRHVPESS